MPADPPSLLQGVLPGLFLATLVCSLLLLIVCHAAPGPLSRWNSVPWAFQLQRAADTELHCTLYAVYHSTLLGKSSHWFFLLDVVAWFALLQGVHPALLYVMLAALMFLASRVRDRVTAFALVLTWAGCAALSVWAAAALGGHAAPWAMALLVGNGVLRFLGHVREPVPPMVGEAVDRFRPLREAHLGARVVLIAWIGYLSEFTAGLPWGLVRVHVAWLVDRVRHRGRPGAWGAAVTLGQEIRAGGFKVHPTLAALIRPYVR